jgi:2-hydroxychromene-2-carboxylate isomerase
MSDVQPVFYYDFNSPFAYLAAERVNHVLPVAPVWQPISFGHLLQATQRIPWSLDERRDEGQREVERRAKQRGLPDIKWIEGWPLQTMSMPALRAGIFAKETGRAVAYSLAAFRQMFAGGKNLADVDNVLIAAAACELHPRAVLKGIETSSVKEELKRATSEAIERGVVGIPTIAVGDQLFWGDDKLEEAAAAIAAQAA